MGKTRRLPKRCSTQISSGLTQKYKTRPVTKTLNIFSYFVSDKEKSVMTLINGVNVMKPFSSFSLTDQQNKLECLTLAVAFRPGRLNLSATREYVSETGPDSELKD
jgi:hypothetical protein